MPTPRPDKPMATAEESFRAASHRSWETPAGIDEASDRRGRSSTRPDAATGPVHSDGTTRTARPQVARLTPVIAKIRMIRAMTRNIPKRTLAIVVAPDATPRKPSAPATIATTNEINAHHSRFTRHLLQSR